MIKPRLGRETPTTSLLDPTREVRFTNVLDLHTALDKEKVTH